MTADTARAAFLADAKATASRAGLTVPERFAYVAAEGARYDDAAAHGNECENPRHDHTTQIDPEGIALDHLIPMTCNGRLFHGPGVPCHYDETVEDYVHDNPDDGACDLAFAADESDPQVSHCEPKGA